MPGDLRGDMSYSALRQQLQGLKNLLYYPALTVQVFYRQRTGFRHLQPSVIMRLALFMWIYLWLWNMLPSSASLSLFGTGSTQTAQDTPQYPPLPEVGFDQPLPENWNRMAFPERQQWIRQHQITDPQRLRQQQEERAREMERRQKDMQERAESAARWAKIRVSLQDLPMKLYILAFLVWGLLQRRFRWRDLLHGVRWHTYSRGLSPLKSVLGGNMREANMLRNVDPLVCFAIGYAVYMISRPLGVWLMFASVAFMVIEQQVYERQLNEQLDQLDNMLDSEVLSQVGREGKGTTAQPMQDTGGVLPTGAASPELAVQVAKRRAERRARIKEKAGERADESHVEQFISQLGIDPDEYEAMTPEQRTALLTRITATMPPPQPIAMPSNNGGLSVSDDDKL